MIDARGENPDAASRVGGSTVFLRARDPGPEFLKGRLRCPKTVGCNCPHDTETGEESY
jgi:hypothetical protein